MDKKPPKEAMGICPECLDPTPESELLMFNGICEDCTCFADPSDDDQDDLDDD